MSDCLRRLPEKKLMRRWYRVSQIDSKTYAYSFLFSHNSPKIK